MRAPRFYWDFQNTVFYYKIFFGSLNKYFIRYNDIVTTYPEINRELQLEILEQLRDPLYGFSGFLSPEIRNIEPIFGGADTRIFSFDLCFDDSTQAKGSFKEILVPLIIRIFRKDKSHEVVKNEYGLMKSLHQAGYSVPKPLLFSIGKASGRSYIVMERIGGLSLSKKWEQAGEDQARDLFDQYIEKMAAIHSFDWKSCLPGYWAPDIGKCPSFFSRYNIDRVSRIVDRYPAELSEVGLVVRWLDEHISEGACEEVVLIHGDYHALNVIVTPDDDLVIIDWTGGRLDDYRLDLGYSIVIMNSDGPMDFKDLSIRKYESLAGKKVRNIEYFMILSNLFNLTRIYSCITDYGITGESGYTRDLYLGAYRSYPEYLIRLIKSETSISLSRLEEALRKGGSGGISAGSAVHQAKMPMAFSLDVDSNVISKGSYDGAAPYCDW